MKQSTSQNQMPRELTADEIELISGGANDDCRIILTRQSGPIIIPPMDQPR